MTLPSEALDALKAFKDKLPKPVVTKKVKRLVSDHRVNGVPVPAGDLVGVPNRETSHTQEKRQQREPKQDNVRRNGPKSWLVMTTTGAAYRGLKSREDPVVRDAPITTALERKASDVSGNTARICNDYGIFKRTK